MIDGRPLPPREWKRVPEDVSLTAAWRAYAYGSRMVELEFSQGEGVFWTGPLSMGDGYATANENMIWALKEQGVKLFVHPCWFSIKDELSPQMAALLKEPLPGPMSVGVCMATPGEFYKLPTEYKIGLTMYEADEPLHVHPEWRHGCSVVDRIVVPSDYCKEVFSTFYKRPIDVVPLAVSPLYYTAQRRQTKSTFTFASFATLSPRKAPLETLEAFTQAFPLETYPDVRIEFKTRNGVFGWRENMLPTITDPRVTIHNGTWTPEQVRDWLHKTDAFLFLSKGEGFGMPPREAMATGLPLIVANNTGLADICDGDYVWPVPTRRTEFCEQLGTWRIPDWDYAIDCMKAVYFNREQAYERGEQAAHWFIENHGAAAAAKKMARLLKKVRPHGHKPLACAESIDDTAQHRAFYEQLQAAQGPILVVGVGTGQLCKALQEMHKQVYAVAETDEEVALCKRLNIKVSKRSPFDLDGLPQVAAIASQGILQQYNFEETRRLLRTQWLKCRNVHFSVPSAYYPEPFMERASPQRLAYWHEVLRGLVAPVHYYHDKHYIRGQIVTEGSPQRGGTGRLLDGQWHN